jgi:hypothetical protein
MNISDEMSLQSVSDERMALTIRTVLHSACARSGDGNIPTGLLDTCDGCMVLELGSSKR